ncbi:hypothetical protein BLA29_008990, partial [Euroglyphus maynei]
SIHSPSTDILNLFDKLYILAKGGICIYFDEPKNLKLTLERNLGEKFDEEKSPIEEYLKIACQGIENKLVRQLADSCVEKERENSEIIQKLCFMDDGIQHQHKTMKMNDLWLQLCRMMYIVFIVERNKLNIMAISFAFLITLLSTMYDPLMVTPNTCYSIDDYENESNITCLQKHADYNRVSQYNIFQTNLIWVSGVTVMCVSTISFLKIIKILRNEHRNKWYSLGTFCISYNIVRFIEISMVAVYVVILNYFTVNHI